MRLIEQIQHYLIGQRSPVTEIDLARHFHVSRTAVRDVLSTLKERGLVERTKRKGTQLKRPDFRETLELVDMRIMMEGFAARLLCEHVSQATMEKLRKSASAYRKAIRRRDMERAHGADIEFHSIITENCGNQRLVHLLKDIHLLSSVFHTLARALMPRTPADTSPYTHERIVTAIAKGSPDQAERVMRKHIEHSRQTFIRRYMKEEPDLSIVD